MGRLTIQDDFYNQRKTDIHLFGNLSAWLAVSILRHYGIDIMISSHKIDQNNGVDFVVFDPDDKMEPISVDITTTHGPSFLKKSAKLGDRKFPVALCEVPTKWNTAFRLLLELVMLGDTMPHSIFPMHIQTPIISIDEKVKKIDLLEGMSRLPESIVITYEPLILQALREMQELWKNSTLKAIKSSRPDMANEVEKLIELTEKVIRTNK